MATVQATETNASTGLDLAYQLVAVECANPLAHEPASPDKGAGLCLCSKHDAQRRQCVRVHRAPPADYWTQAWFHEHVPSQSVRHWTSRLAQPMLEFAIVNNAAAEAGEQGAHADHGATACLRQRVGIRPGIRVD